MKAWYTDVIPFLFLNFDRSFEDGMWANWPLIPRVGENGIDKGGEFVALGMVEVCEL